MLSRAGRAAVSLLLSSAFVQNINGRTQSQGPINLRQARLEDLMDITVTSVSRKEEKLSKAASAAFVITREDIRRSGATNIPHLLRMAPRESTGIRVVGQNLLRARTLEFGNATGLIGTESVRSVYGKITWRF